MKFNLADFREKWVLSIKVLIIIVIPGLIIQYIIRSKGLNVLDMNIIIASLLTGAVFLIGFMLAGTLQDFKESEQLIGNLATGILSIQDTNRLQKSAQKRRSFLIYLTALTKTIKGWLEQTKTYDDVLKSINDLSNYFKQLPDSERVQDEQKMLRQIVMRIHVIKETTFIKAGYTIMEIISAAVIILIMFSQSDIYLLGAATYAASSFTLVYMIMLIRDMDDPFEFSTKGDKKGVAEVSIIPLQDALSLLEKEQNA